MKKTFLLLLALSLLLFACGCSADDSADNNADNSADDSIVNSEFSLTADGVSLSLGPQTGEFPWGADVVEEDAAYWEADGFQCFEITCNDGTKLQGCRADGMEDATDGTLMSMETADSAWQTPRGVCVGMSRDEVLELYPEANPTQIGTADPLIDSYEYHTEDVGFYQMVFNFEQDQLASIIMADGMDGYMY